MRFTGLGPKNFYLNSPKFPVTLSTTDLNKIPFYIPMCKISYPLIWHSLIDEGNDDGISLIVTYSRLLSGSRDKTLTVVSSQAKNKNLYLNLPS